MVTSACCCSTCTTFCEFEFGHTTSPSDSDKRWTLTGWTVISGSWSLGTHSAGFGLDWVDDIRTDDDDAIVIYDAGLDMSQATRIELSINAIENETGVIIGYLDSNNYIWIEFLYGGATVSGVDNGVRINIWNIEAGTSTLVNSGLSTGLSIAINYRPDEPSHRLTVDASSVTIEGDVVAPGTQFGFKTGDTSAGTSKYTVLRVFQGAACAVAISCDHFAGTPRSADQISQPFDVLSGTWAFNSDYLDATAAGVCLLRPRVPGGWQQMGVEAKVSYTAGAKWRTLCNVLDVDNYHFVEYEDIVGIGIYGQCGVRTAGAETLLGSQRPMSGPSTAQSHAIINSEFLGVTSSRLRDISGSWAFSDGDFVTPFSGGDRAGFQLVSGNVKFRNIHSTAMNDRTGSPDRGTCRSAYTCYTCSEPLPPTLSLTVSGTGNSGCGTCNLDGTYILAFDPIDPSSGTVDGWIDPRGCTYRSATFVRCGLTCQFVWAGESLNPSQRSLAFTTGSFAPTASTYGIVTASVCTLTTSGTFSTIPVNEACDCRGTYTITL